MGREFSRAQRVAQVIHHALSLLIQKEVPSGEFGMITVSQVKLSPGLDYAKVYITILNEDKTKTIDVIRLLEENNKHLRHLLSRSVKLRITPELHFYYDTSQTNVRRLTSLIDEAVESDKKLHQDGAGGE